MSGSLLDHAPNRQSSIIGIFENDSYYFGLSVRLVYKPKYQCNIK